MSVLVEAARELKAFECDQDTAHLNRASALLASFAMHPNVSAREKEQAEQEYREVYAIAARIGIVIETNGDVLPCPPLCITLH